MLFNPYDRTDASRKLQAESSWAFLDRSARPEIVRVREYLETAVSNYPAAERDELVARLRSGDEVAFRSTTFEVLLHWGLLSMGCTLQPHPDPGTGSAKRPDFLVRSPDGEEFFLEAVLAGERDGKSQSAESIKRTTLDRLDAAAHASFMLDIDSSGDPLTQPPAKDLVRLVHGWLDTLSVDELRSTMETVGFEAMPTLDWMYEGWSLTLRPIPLKPERRGRIERLIGSFGDGARWVNAWEPLRDNVKAKATRYGALTKPLVVAVNVDTFNLDAIDEVQALYGEESWVEVLGHPERSEPQRKPNGAWRGPKGPTNRRVSAVWFFNDLTPYTLASRRSTVYLNPWSYLPAPNFMLAFPHKKLTTEKLVAVEGKSLAEFFGITAAWPE